MSVRASSRKSRVYLFREFIWRVYGEYLTEELNLQNKKVQIDETRKHEAPCGFDDGFNHDILVLDVAGGKGDLSWLLRHVHGISSVVIDPRDSYNHNSQTNKDSNGSTKSTVRPHHIEKSVHYLLQHPEEAQRRVVPGLPTFQPLAALISQIVEQTKTQKRQRQDEGNSFQTNKAANENDDASRNRSNDIPVLQFQPIRHIPIYMNDELVNAVRQQLELEENSKVDLGFENNGDVESIRNDNEVCRKQRNIGDDWKTYWKEVFGNQVGNGGNSDCFSNPAVAWNTFRSAKLIVGFHPDQATEACMDLAILLKIPFCVVPCCVFPSEFPHRKILTSSEGIFIVKEATQEGSKFKAKSLNVNETDDRVEDGSARVRTYSQFLAYLKAKYQSINVQTATLEFHFTETAKNIVLYTLPPRQSLETTWKT